MKVSFHVPVFTGEEKEHIDKVLKTKKICGEGFFTRRCEEILENQTGCKKVLLTSSFAHAMEMSALLLNIGPGDEVIMSSFCSSSAANAFVLRGAKIVFVDIRPDTMNMNEELLEEAVTEKTRVIVPFHYAGVACDMKHIMEVAKKYNLYVVENVEHGLMGKYFDDYLGTMGDLGCVGFHEGGSYACGQGGALFINREDLVERAEWIRD